MSNHGTLAESFLEDLDELGGNSEEDNQDEGFNDLMDDLNDSDEDEDENEDDLDAVLGKIAAVKGISNIALLRKSLRFQEHLKKIETCLNENTSAITGSLEDDSEYKLLVLSNTIIHDIDEEIKNIHRYVAELYAKKFPELESLVPNKIDYMRTVKRIGNEMDMTLVELGDLLSSATVMVVSVTGSTTSGQPLSPSDLDECNKGCDEILQLDSDKALILKYVESRMNHIAPNLCCMIGSRIAAQLVGLAGGIIALSKIPACNLQVIGQEKRNLSGFSNIAAMPHIGILYYCEIIQNCPPYLRKRALKVVAAKVVLAARVDCYRHHPDGGEGQRMRKELEEKLEKWTEPPKAQTKKARPIPEEKKRNKRGGKRVRRWKERYLMTDIRAAHNKICFSDTVGEYGDSAMGQDSGMIGQQDGGGRTRAIKKKEVHLAKKQKKVVNMSSGQTNGISSSLVFTPVQGLELVNPNAAQERVKEANKKWFDANSGFLSAAPK